MTTKEFPKVPAHAIFYSDVVHAMILSCGCNSHIFRGGFLVHHFE
jgi:hypothetical protein